MISMEYWNNPYIAQSDPAKRIIISPIACKYQRRSSVFVVISFTNWGKKKPPCSGGWGK
jgi:hypothetical protein